ncbi:conserved Plasmodium protein, unknown function [Plasmodium ovale wallikeri]|uniref:SURF1-like protein n=1 Tax=Plasmodium ovale wallikeri TaxID=864142 RepID=A0A1A8YWU7_PLAOA|nr:conserved Plasmodium protein, unknown function [Plasmodium ovale wallikeri]SBT36323.1 conserved Plasmodium protein, unknown function [Plasmodium ovale wallikeri]
MKRFPFFFNDIGGKIIEEKIKSFLLRSETFHRMPFLNNVLDSKSLIVRLSENSFLDKWERLQLHVGCTPSLKYADKCYRKRKHVNRLVDRANMKRLLLFSKNGKCMQYTKRKKKMSTFAECSGEKNFTHNVHIDLLNEELQNIENKINEKRIIKNKDKEISLTHFKYPSQKLYKANEEDINLIRKSEGQYYMPLECENSTIIRLIDIKNKASSPIFRNYKMLSEQLEKYEKEKELIHNINLSGVFLCVLAFYEQVRIFFCKIYSKKNKNWNNTGSRKESVKGKEDENVAGGDNLSKNERVGDLERRDENEQELTVDLENVSNMYDWIVRMRNENWVFKMCRRMLKKGLTEKELKKLVVEKYKYRKVQLTGVLDTTNEFYVGPKSYQNNKKKVYYYVICPLFLRNGKCILVNRGLIPEEMLEEKKREIPKVVTIRGVLDPGELYECSFKKLMNFSNKSTYSNYFFYYNTEEICHHANVSHFDGSSYFIANIYDIIVHEDYNSEIIKNCYADSDKGRAKELDANLKKISDISIHDMDRESQERIKRLLICEDNVEEKRKKPFQNSKPFRYDEHFIHKKKKEYFKFYADETTHFNYACQWFLFSFVFSTISVFKFVQFKKWVF